MRILIFSVAIIRISDVAFKLPREIDDEISLFRRVELWIEQSSGDVGRGLEGAHARYVQVFGAQEWFERLFRRFFGCRRACIRRSAFAIAFRRSGDFKTFGQSFQ